jgi:hypothetical protein
VRRNPVRHPARLGIVRVPAVGQVAGKTDLTRCVFWTRKNCHFMTIIL